MRFIDNRDGTITDTKTDLIWQKEADCKAYTWPEAMNYCRGLNLAGHEDWRLPTVQELVSLVDYGRFDMAIDPAFQCFSAYYWSSTTNAYNTDSAWNVSFYSGSNYYYDKSNSYYVRAVREGKEK